MFADDASLFSIALDDKTSAFELNKDLLTKADLTYQESMSSTNLFQQCNIFFVQIYKSIYEFIQRRNQFLIIILRKKTSKAMKGIGVKNEAKSFFDNLLLQYAIHLYNFFLTVHVKKLKLFNTMPLLPSSMLSKMKLS